MDEKGKQSAFKRLRQLITGTATSVQTGDSGLSCATRLDDVSGILDQALFRMNKSQSTLSRVKFIQDFMEFVATYRIDRFHEIWYSIEDLMHSSNCHYRTLVYNMLGAIVRGQYDHLGAARIEYLSILETAPYGQEQEKLIVLDHLTNFGRDIQLLEGRLGALLLMWMNTSASDIVCVSKLIVYATNLLKYNARNLSLEDVNRIIQAVCRVSNMTQDAGMVEHCLEFIDVIIRYSAIPQEILPDCVEVLCRTVNIDRFCQQSWTIMKNLLKSFCGHQVMATLLVILEDSSSLSAVNLLRGAVFFVGMASWGSQRVTSLFLPVSSMLPPFARVLEHSQHDIVAYEIVLSIGRLVSKYGAQLRAEWDVLFSILLSVHPFVDMSGTSFLPRVLDIFDSLIALWMDGKYLGDDPSLLHCFILYKDVLAESKVLLIMERYFQELNPSMDGWVDIVQDFLRTFFVMEKRSRVREKALGLFRNAIFENVLDSRIEALIEASVLPTCATIGADEDPIIRMRGIELIIDLAKALRWKCRQFEGLVNLLDPSTWGDQMAASARGASLAGLSSIFAYKFTRLPSSHVLYLYDILVRLISSSVPTVRREALKWSIGFSADSRFCVSFNGITSHLLTCSALNVGVNSTYLPFSKLWSALIAAFEREVHVDLCDLTFRGLANLLRSYHALCDVQVQDLCVAICTWLRRRTYLKSITAIPRDLCRISNVAFRTLSLLVGYKSRLSSSDQRMLVHTLLSGLSFHLVELEEPQNAQDVQVTCVRALAICFAEIPDVIVDFLPSIVHAFLRMHTMPSVATAVFEAIADMVAIPTVLSPLRQKDIARVFSIIIDFGESVTTSESARRYARYICYIHLPHWFLRLPLASRTKFLPMLLAGIQANGDYFEKRSRQPSLLAETALDMLGRYAHSDCLPYVNRSPFYSFLFDDKQDEESRTWVHGTTLLTVRMGRLAWAEVTVRKATGTVCWVMQLQNHVSRTAKPSTHVNPLPSPKDSVRNEALFEASDACAPAQKDTLKERHQGFELNDFVSRILCTSENVDTVLNDFSKTTNRHLDAVPDSLLVLKKISDSSSTGSLEDEIGKGICGDWSVASTPHEHEFGKSSGVLSESSVTSGRANSSDYNRVRSPLLPSDQEFKPLVDEIHDVSGHEAPARQATLEFSFQATNGGDSLSEHPRRLRRSHSQPPPSPKCHRGGNGHDNGDSFIETSASGKAKLLKGSGCDRESISTESKVTAFSNLRQTVNSGFNGPTTPGSFENSSVFSLGNADVLLATSAPSPSKIIRDTHCAGANPVVNRLFSLYTPLPSYDCDDPESSRSPALIPGFESEASSSNQSPSPSVRLSVEDQMKLHWHSSEASSALQSNSSTRANASEVLNSHGFRTSSNVTSSMTAPPGEFLSSPFDGRSASRSGTSLGTEAEAPTATDIPVRASAEHTLNFINFAPELNSKPIPEGREFSEELANNPVLEGKKSTGNSIPSVGSFSPEMLQKTTLQSPGISPPDMVSLMEDRFDKSEDCCLSNVKVMETCSTDVGTEFSLTPPKCSTTSSQLRRGVSSPEIVHDSPMVRVVQRTRRDREEYEVVEIVKKQEVAGMKSISSMFGSGMTTARGDPFTGVQPSFLFMQLHQMPITGSPSAKAKVIRPSESLNRCIKGLDRVPTVETHKIGVIYVAPHQSGEAEILGNSRGSAEYTLFLESLGDFKLLRGREHYSGGLDRTEDADGEFALVWQSELAIVVYHVATLMPMQSPHWLANKKRHIGNDYVNVVFTDSDMPFDHDTLPGQFNFVNIVIRPRGEVGALVSVTTKDDSVGDFGPLCPGYSRMVSWTALPILVRQTALHANLRCQTSILGEKYLSNWEERLLQLQRLKERATSKVQKQPASCPVSPMESAPFSEKFQDVDLTDFL